MDYRLRYLLYVMHPRIRIRIHVKRHGSGRLTECKHMCSIKSNPKNLSHPGGKPTALYQWTTRALETTLLVSCTVLLVPGSGDRCLGHTTVQCCGSVSPWCGSGCGSGSVLFDADAVPDTDPPIQVTKMTRIYADPDPDPQHCYWAWSLSPPHLLEAPVVLLLVPGSGDHSLGSGAGPGTPAPTSSSAHSCKNIKTVGICTYVSISVKVVSFVVSYRTERCTLITPAIAQSHYGNFLHFLPIKLAKNWGELWYVHIFFISAKVVSNVVS